MTTQTQSNTMFIKRLGHSELNGYGVDLAGVVHYAPGTPQEQTLFIPLFGVWTTK